MAKDSTFNLTIKVNGKQVENSLNGVGKELGKLNRDLKKLTPGTDAFIAKSKELKDTREKYQSIKDEINQTNTTLDEARGHWDNLMSGFLSGNPELASQGLKGIAGNIKGITKAAWAFIATPIGAAIAVFAGIALAAKQWVSYNLEIEKTNQLIRDLTQETGAAVDIIRIRAEELQKSFGTDISQSVESAKSMVKSFGITYNEAFDIIEDGGIRGKLKNDEFLQSLREYPIQFKNAGFSAQDFANIVSTGIDLSIYSDKLPDAIKEFNLAITEQTEAAKEALTNAFGERFTTNLLTGLKNGSISAKDALATISAEAERIGLNSQQAQLLTADLFKGAGEDAGGALKIFEAVNLALNEQKKPLTEVQQIQKEQLETNKELNSVYTQLFASGSSGFNIWIQKGKLFATEILLKILKGGVDVYNWFIDLNNESRVFSGIITGFSKSASFSFAIISEGISLISKQFGSLGDIIAGIFTFDVDRITKGFASGITNIAASFEKLKQKQLSNAAEIANAFQGNNKLERINLDDLLAGDPSSATPTDEPTVTPTNNNTSAVVNSDGLTEKDKQILESKKRLKELLKENELVEEAQRLEEEMLSAETLAEKTELEFERLRWIAEQELDIQREKELEALRLKNASEEELKATEDKFRLKKDALNKKLDQEKAKAEEKIKADKKAEDEKAIKDEEILNTQRLQAYSNMFGNMAYILGEHTAAGKAAAIAQATINTWQGVSQVWKAESVLPEPFATAAKVVSTGTVLASGLKAVGVIKGTNTKFFDGGPTGDRAMYTDEYGAVTGVVHDNEWVAPKFMTQSPRYAPTLHWLETQRKKELGKFFDGGSTSKTSTPDFTEDDAPMPQSNAANLAMIQLLQKLDSKLDQGFKGYMVRDYEDFLNQKNIDQDHQQILDNTRS